MNSGNRIFFSFPCSVFCFSEQEVFKLNVEMYWDSIRNVRIPSLFFCQGKKNFKLPSLPYLLEVELVG